MFALVALNLFFVAVASLFYKPPPGPKAQTAADLSTPKSEEGEAIYDGAGTFWVQDAHVIWSGDFKSEAIKKKSGGKK